MLAGRQGLVHNDVEKRPVFLYVVIVYDYVFMFLLCRNVVIHTCDIKHRHKMTSHLCRYVSSVQKRLKWLVSLPAHIVPKTNAAHNGLITVRDDRG